MSWPIICALAGTINATAEPFITIGSGLCYHYNSYYYTIHYENVQLRGVIMTPERWRTIRMQPEQYVIIDYYTKNAFIGMGYSFNNNLVYSVGIKAYIVSYLSASVIVYQSNMNHVVIGLNLEL